MVLIISNFRKKRLKRALEANVQKRSPFFLEHPVYQITNSIYNKIFFKIIFKRFRNLISRKAMLFLWDKRKPLPGAVLSKRCSQKFRKIHRKHTCTSGLRSATLLKKKLWHRYFLVNFAQFLKTPVFIEHLWWLLLDKIHQVTK